MFIFLNYGGNVKKSKKKENWNYIIKHVIQLDENFILKTKTLAIKAPIFMKNNTKNTSKSKNGDTGSTTFRVGLKCGHGRKQSFLLFIITLKSNPKLKIDAISSTVFQKKA